MSITVIKPGLQTTIQAGPRIGSRHLGVPANGAADPLSLALANKLVGNDWDAPALEATLLGPVLRFEAPCLFALTGARTAATLNGAALLQHKSVVAMPGDVLAAGSAEIGVRVYISIAGGLQADDVLGSRSTNLQAGFGGLQGRALQTGDVLAFESRDTVPLETPEMFRLPLSTSWGLRTCVGKEAPLFADEVLARFFDTNWLIDRRSDRMGLRLEGPALESKSDGRMPSAGVFPGTIQCPEDGLPYILSVDAGTVGGYPRIAQVTRADRHILGQLRQGDHVRLLRRDPDEALEELRAKIGYWQDWLPDIEEILR
ncbi:MAG: biotin-dependent carboxyltransferase family protein [Gammaproteobacteria bacterium]|nr:biotin-dependent carboxyltransferase family protein [Gammaproteobacteria bacterium]